MERPEPARRARLEQASAAGPRFRLAERRLVAGVPELEAFFDLAVGEGAEGLVCKSIAPDAVYRAGVRTRLWIKLKRDARSPLADRVDLVAVGALNGRGRRAGTYGSVGHGLQKLVGWFGGHGLAGTAGVLRGLGLRHAKLWAALTGLAELLGGAGLALGLLTPVAAALVAAVILAAIVFVHGPEGLWSTRGGYEYNLVLLAAASAVGLHGAGPYGLDAVVQRQYGLGLPVPPVAAFVVALLLALVALGVELIVVGKTGRSAQRRGGATATA
jgi:putative oxidoreductase